jgi:hypothetical protein
MIQLREELRQASQDLQAAIQALKASTEPHSDSTGGPAPQSPTIEEPDLPGHLPTRITVEQQVTYLGVACLGFLIGALVFQR